MKPFIITPIILCLFILVMEAQPKYPFQNPDLTTTERVDDLVARLTLEEKVGQLQYKAPAVERLGIPEYNWWNEGLHGVARAGKATIFPQAIGLAATWDTDLVQRIGQTIGIEARAKYNAFSKAGQRGQYQGLTFWSPNVNIFRDPRWGRGQETYGEDPFLTSKIGVSFVKGLQGDHPEYLLAAGMGKHFAVHNGPEGLRHEFNATVSQKDLWETYLPAFEALVKEADVAGIMGAYNRVNGDPSCAHPYLMNEILRTQWGFKGYFVSDCWAIRDFYQGHEIVETVEEAAAMAVNSGCNLNCGDSYKSLIKAIEAGHTTEETIDRNLKELLPTRFKLGLFDPSPLVPFDSIGAEVIRSDKHLQLAREAATKSIVLLKNKNATLPLDKDIPSVYVTGPTAAHVQALLANYYGLSPQLSTLLEGIVGKVGPSTSMRYSQGALLDEENRNPIDWYSGTAAEAEVTIACIGISQLIEGEEGESIASRHKGDRADIRLPENQLEFLRKIRKNAKKLVVVVTGGSAIAMPEVYDMADALLFAWYPGEQGGEAVGDIIFGDAVPSGRLPVTFVKRLEDLPPYENYALDGRTYRYFEGEPLFPFGFGLSYSTFDYSQLRMDRTEIKASETIEASFDLKNTGTIEAEEVVQLYVSDLQSSNVQPIQSLKYFQRVALAPGEKKTIAFTITPDMLKMVNDEGKSIIEPGEFRIYIGGSASTNVNEKLGASKGVSDTVKILKQ